MQTFLPYADFAETARVLDRRRLGKQRVETLQVLRALTVPGYGWRNHPAVRMWRGHLEGLVCYGVVITDHWLALGYADTVRPQLLGFTGGKHPRPQRTLARRGLLPSWLGDPELHRSHQSSLVRKDPNHYGPLFPDVPDDLPYVWPATA
jgi:hypothetical protein